MTDSRLPVLPPLPDETSERAATVLLPPAPGVAASVEPPVEREPLRDRSSSRPPRRPRERRGSRQEEGRRLWSAGHAIVVLTLALAIGLLLNAPGIHKKAYNQPDGWERDVALAFTGPLNTVSHALLLDRPRKAVQAAIGRSGTDDIDTEVAIAVGVPEPPGSGSAAPKPSSGKTTEATAAPKPRPTAGAGAAAVPAREAFTPEKQLRLWVAGDSLVITPGYAILRAAGATPVVTGVGGVDGRVATGLTRPDVFNWFTQIRDRMKTLKPDVVVLAFGGNDDKAYMTGLPESVSIGDFGDASWTREYRRRVAGVFDIVNRAGAHAIWIGLPPTADRDQSRRFDIVNAAVHAEAKRRPKSVTYLDTYLLFGTAGGGFSQYQTRGDATVKIRADDGVHFERAGGDIIAREVLKRLNQVYDLTSWRARSGRG